jgi:Rhs element Vgr protein
MDTEKLHDIDGQITCQVKSDGQEIDFLHMLISVETVAAFGRLSTAEVVFQDDIDSLSICESDSLKIGSVMEIAMGRGDDTSCIFKGIVCSRGLKYGKEGAEVVVTAKHEAFKMTHARPFRIFEDMTDSDIISQICSDHGLTADVEDTQVSHEKLVQYNCTDWDFVNMRAEAAGLLVSTTPEGIKVAKPDPGAESAVTIDAGFSVNSIEIEVNGKDLYPGVSAQAWNYISQDKDEAEVQAGSADTAQGEWKSADLAGMIGNENLTLRLLSGQNTPDAMQMLAEARAVRSDLSRITGRLAVPGLGGIDPGGIISLNGFSKHYDGDALVSAVVHDYSKNDWETTFALGLKQTPYYEQFSDIDTKSSDGVTPAAPGLQIAKVEALEGDPQGDERIRVKLMGSDEAALWARIALLDAGSDRGSVFMPEIDDEVVVGFLAGNPSEPVVLGMLHSSSLASPIPKSDDNHVKGFVTRSQLTVEFDDDKKVMTLKTPGGNSLILSDDDQGITIEDQNGNKITMSSDGISLESAKDVQIKANGDVKAEGVNINLNANAQMVAKGSASAEISSSGNTVVKGSIVQIN